MVEFQKLSEVEKTQEVSENASVLIEDNGEIKRIDKSQVGGGLTAVFKRSDYDEFKEYIFNLPEEPEQESNIAPQASGPEYTWTCSMTFEELKDAILNCKEVVGICYMPIENATTPFAADGDTTYYNSLAQISAATMSYYPAQNGLPEYIIAFFSARITEGLLMYASDNAITSVGFSIG